MSMELLQRIKTLEVSKLELQARLEKVEAYIWGEEANDTLDDFEHGTVPKRKRGRPRKEEVANG